MMATMCKEGKEEQQQYSIHIRWYKDIIKQKSISLSLRQS